jgi:hypothetical protein
MGSQTDDLTYAKGIFASILSGVMWYAIYYLLSTSSSPLLGVIRMLMLFIAVFIFPFIVLQKIDDFEKSVIYHGFFLYAFLLPFSIYHEWYDGEDFWVHALWDTFVASGIAYFMCFITCWYEPKKKPATLKKSTVLKSLICPLCKNYIQKSWNICPYCGAGLRGTKRVYDDDTRIY